jgi:hypothetical protein
MKNLDLKEMFLKDKPKTYEYILSKVYKYEDQLNKDMFDFSTEEWLNILNDKSLFNPMSNQYKNTVRKIFGDYINFAIEQYYSGINMINVFKSGLVI